MDNEKVPVYSYTYDEEGDWYNIQSPRGIRGYSGEVVRSMVRQYVKSGDNRTMLEVAVEACITHKDFYDLKTALGITKAHLPFTPEELADRDFDGLLDETLGSKIRKLTRRSENMDLQRVRAYAARWLELETGSLRPIKEYLEKGRPLSRKAVSWRTEKPTEGYLLHIHGSDLHFGALVVEEYGSPTYNCHIARERYLKGLSRAVEFSKPFGDPAVIVNPAGGDFVHHDNIQGKTSSTKNQMDLDGIPEDIFVRAVDLYLEGVEFLLESTESLIRVEVVPGNHDYMLSVAMGLAARERFHGNPRVVIGNLLAPYAYLQWGDSALVLHHGHGRRKAPELADLLGSWAKTERVAYRYGYAITGNLHHVASEEDPGVMLLQQPSPAGSDRYHTLGGWTTARPAMMAYAFDRTSGMLYSQYIPFE